MQPARPTHLSEHAERTLQALANAGLGHAISVGGAWREAVDAAKLLTSPAYHLVRTWHRLPTLPYLGQQSAMIRDDPSLLHV